MSKALMAAGFLLSAAGSVAQMNATKKAAQVKAEMAKREAEGAIANAKKVRKSAEAALTDQQSETRVIGEQRKSDMARRADRESSELVAMASERGQMGTTTFLRQAQQLYYFNETDSSRMERDVTQRVASLQRDKEQVVEDQKRVLNNASLSMYSANVNSKLATAQANRQAFFNIAKAGVNIGMKSYEHKMLKDITANRIPRENTIL